MRTFKFAVNRTFGSLRIRNFRLYFIGQIVSMSGTWMQSVAQAWLVLSITGSAVAVGVTVALQFLPVLVFGAFGGVIADRFDKRRMLITTQSTSAVLALLLGILTTTGLIHVWMIYGLALLLGCVSVFDTPCRQAFVVEMVGRESLPNAIGLSGATFTSSRVIGPAIAGALIAKSGVSICFFLNAFSFGAVVIALWRMDVGALMKSEPVPRERGQVRAGLRYVKSEPGLLYPLILMAIIGTLAFNFQTLMPLMAKQVFHGGPGAFGAMSSLMGLGSVIGALSVAARQKPTSKLLVGTALMFGIFLMAYAFAPSLGVALAILIPTGIFGIGFISTANSTLQLNSSNEMRGRVMALYSVVFLGSTPIGSPALGWVAEHFGPRVGVALGGGASLLAGLAGIVFLATRGERTLKRRAPVAIQAAAALEVEGSLEGVPTAVDLPQTTVGVENNGLHVPTRAAEPAEITSK